MRSRFSALFACALALFLYLLVPGLAAAVGAAVVGIPLTDYSAAYGTYYSTLCPAVMFAVYALFLRGKGRSPAAAAMIVIQPEPWAKLALTGAALNVFVSSALSLLPEKITAGYLEIVTQREFTVPVMLTVAFLSPAVEEILFRGLIQTRLLRAFVVPAAVTLTSLTFGLMHVHPLWVVYACAMGAVLSAVSLWRRNVIAAVCLHISFNLTTFIMLPFSEALSGGTIRAALTIVGGGLTMVLLKGLYTERK